MVLKRTNHQIWHFRKNITSLGSQPTRVAEMYGTPITRNNNGSTFSFGLMASSISQNTLEPQNNHTQNQLSIGTGSNNTMNKLIAIILLWLSTSVTAGKGKGMGRSMSGMMMMGSSSKSKSGKGKGKGKGYYPDNYYYYYYPEIVFPPYGSNAIDLPKYPDWVVYAALANRIGVANAESPPADLSGTLLLMSSRNKSHTLQL